MTTNREIDFLLLLFLFCASPVYSKTFSFSSQITFILIEGCCNWSVRYFGSGVQVVIFAVRLLTVKGVYL